MTSGKIRIYSASISEGTLLDFFFGTYGSLFKPFYKGDQAKIFLNDLMRNFEEIGPLKTRCGLIQFTEHSVVKMLPFWKVDSASILVMQSKMEASPELSFRIFNTAQLPAKSKISFFVPCLMPVNLPSQISSRPSVHLWYPMSLESNLQVSSSPEEGNLKFGPENQLGNLEDERFLFATAGTDSKIIVEVFSVTFPQGIQIPLYLKHKDNKFHICFPDALINHWIRRKEDDLPCLNLDMMSAEQFNALSNMLKHVNSDPFTELILTRKFGPSSVKHIMSTLGKPDNLVKECFKIRCKDCNRICIENVLPCMVGDRTEIWLINKGDGQSISFESDEETLSNTDKTMTASFHYVHCKCGAPLGISPISDLVMMPNLTLISQLNDNLKKIGAFPVLRDQILLSHGAAAALCILSGHVLQRIQHLSFTCSPESCAFSASAFFLMFDQVNLDSVSCCETLRDFLKEFSTKNISNSVLTNILSTDSTRGWLEQLNTTLQAHFELTKSRTTSMSVQEREALGLARNCMILLKKILDLPAKHLAQGTSDASSKSLAFDPWLASVDKKVYGGAKNLGSDLSCRFEDCVLESLSVRDVVPQLGNLKFGAPKKKKLKTEPDSLSTDSKAFQKVAGIIAMSAKRPEMNDPTSNRFDDDDEDLDFGDWKIPVERKQEMNPVKAELDPLETPRPGFT